MTQTQKTLSETDVERLYDSLAHAIDQATPEKESVFLAKLALLMAKEIGDVDCAERLIELSLKDLE